MNAWYEHNSPEKRYRLEATQTQRSNVDTSTDDNVIPIITEKQLSLPIESQHTENVSTTIKDRIPDDTSNKVTNPAKAVHNIPDIDSAVLQKASITEDGVDKDKSIPMYSIGTTTFTNNGIISVGNATPEPGLSAQDFFVTANRHFLVSKPSTTLNNQNSFITSLVDFIQGNPLGNLNFNPN